jgi:fructosamine-3-kinase
VSLPEPLAAAIARATGRRATGASRVAGGDINDAWRVDLEGGERAFVKTRADAAPGEYAAEAAALRWLAEPGAVGIPRVLGVADDDEPRLLALAWVDEGTAGDEALLGRGVALLHEAGADAFGATWPMRIGPLLASNDPLPGWPEFYAERRLRPLLREAVDRGAISPPGTEAVERVCERIGELTGPPEPPARLHGDLWSGNVLWGADRRPWLVDPASYGGHREVDLAMLELFGSPGRRFYDAYEEVRPLAGGHEERVALYQLFPLLVHAALFGGGYGATAERAARRYA